MVRKTKYRLTRGAVSTALLATFGIALWGCARHSAESQQEKTEAVQSESPSTSASGGNAVRAYIDPATGKLRDPTPEDIAAQNAAEAQQKKTADSASQKPTEPKEIHHPDGSISVELGDSAQQSLQGCIAPNGETKMEHDCESKQGTKK